METELENMVKRKDFTIRNMPMKDVGMIKTFLRTKDGGIIAVDSLQ